MLDPILRLGALGNGSQASSSPSEPIGDNGYAKTFLAWTHHVFRHQGPSALKFQATSKKSTQCKMRRICWVYRNSNQKYRLCPSLTVYQLSPKSSQSHLWTQQACSKGSPLWGSFSIPSGNYIFSIEPNRLQPNGWDVNRNPPIKNKDFGLSFTILDL